MDIHFPPPYEREKVQEKLIGDIQSRLQLALRSPSSSLAILYSFFKFVGDRNRAQANFLKAKAL